MKILFTFRSRYDDSGHVRAPALLHAFEIFHKRPVGRFHFKQDPGPLYNQLEILDHNTLRRFVVIDNLVRRPIDNPHPNRMLFIEPDLFFRSQKQTERCRWLRPITVPFVDDAGRFIFLKGSQDLVKNGNQFRPVITDVTDHFYGILGD